MAQLLDELHLLDRGIDAGIEHDGPQQDDPQIEPPGIRLSDDLVIAKLV